jgi:hypothetical protein
VTEVVGDDAPRRTRLVLVAALAAAVAVAVVVRVAYHPAAQARPARSRVPSSPPASPLTVSGYTEFFVGTGTFDYVAQFANATDEPVVVTAIDAPAVDGLRVLATAVVTRGAWDRVQATEATPPPIPPDGVRLDPHAEEFLFLRIAVTCPHQGSIPLLRVHVRRAGGDATQDVLTEADSDLAKLPGEACSEPVGAM